MQLELNTLKIYQSWRKIYFLVCFLLSMLLLTDPSSHQRLTFHISGCHDSTFAQHWPGKHRRCNCQHPRHPPARTLVHPACTTPPRPCPCPNSCPPRLRRLCCCCYSAQPRIFASPHFLLTDGTKNEIQEILRKENKIKVLQDISWGVELANGLPCGNTISPYFMIWRECFILYFPSEPLWSSP